MTLVVPFKLSSWTLVGFLCTATLVLTVKGLSAPREVDRLARKVVDELQRRLDVIGQGNAVERRDAESERIRVSEFGCPFSGPQKRSQRALKAEFRSARAASIYEEATRIVKSRLSASGPGVTDGVLARVNQWLKREKSDSCGVCPVQTPSSCDPRKPYREPDGSCNNLKNPTWGQAYACERRLLPAAYQDGISEPRAALSGRPLPNARRVSYKMHTAKEAPDRRLTHLTMAFGQFLDHDLTATPPGTLPPLETFLGAGSCIQGIVCGSLAAAVT
ncbi:hypothetical protein V5799_031572 [Amblyomma americanum]|uniref:Uncharacterized protein n=1 Tax=Amblyomma americanum TaxID=6943 RepID=A0AAQ4DTM6_AMBAM